MYRTALSLVGLFLCMGVSQPAWSSDYPPRQANPVNVKQIHSGHSLSDTYMVYPWPGLLILATSALRGTQPYDNIAKSTTPGAGLKWRWHNPVEHGAPDARQDIGRFELLVTTEGVPLYPDPQAFKVDTLDYVEKWVKHAWQNGNHGKGAEVMLYSTWVWWQNPGDVRPDGEGHIPFRERLDIEGARWEQMQDHANAVRPEGMPLIYMIPGHKLMMRIYDDIEAGKAPGLSSIGDIFEDDIHVNKLGRYAVTCLVWAVIYQRNPREIPNTFIHGDNQKLVIPYEQANYFKKVALEVAQDYDRAGVP